MATSKGAAIASPQIFNSDPLEQIFARQLDGPNGGMMYSFFANARGDRERNQEDYMQQLQQSNALAAILQNAEIQAKTKQELLKLAAGAMEKGFLPSDMPALDDLFGGQRGRGDAMARLIQAEIQSKINNNNASAANAGGDKIKVSYDIGPGGTPGFTRVDAAGRDTGIVGRSNPIVDALIKQKQREGMITAADRQRAAEQNARSRYSNISE